MTEPLLTALAPIAPEVLEVSPVPTFSAAQMTHAFNAYRALQSALDVAMPDQIQTIGDREFRKKGYWRAVSVAFNLTVECIEERRETIECFGDGRDNFGYFVTYRASAPGGRSMPGDGACFAVEKAERFRCPHPEGPNSRRTLHYPATNCPDFDPFFSWRVLPQEATEHNVRAHAHTRAFNRAVSNLVGFGEVSAEEIERDEHERERGAAPSSRGEVLPISPAQHKRLWAIAKGKGWSEAAVKDLAAAHGFASTDIVSRGRAYDAICATLSGDPTTGGPQ